MTLVWQTAAAAPPPQKFPRFQKISFVFPADGVPNNNQAIGPFCCTGRTATIETMRGTPVGYIYFFSWEGQAIQVGDLSYAPKFQILVSGLRKLSDASSGQEKSSVEFAASEMTSQASKWTKAGALYFTVTIRNSVNKVINDQSYFSMKGVEVKVNVSLTEPSPKVIVGMRIPTPIGGLVIVVTPTPTTSPVSIPTPTPVPQPAPTCSVSGVVTTEGNQALLQGVTMELFKKGSTLQAVQSKRLESMGGYTFLQIPAGEYEVVPTGGKAMVFTPSSQTVRCTGGAVSGMDFKVRLSLD